MNNDLPPGCSINNIPGNTSEDEQWENTTETILKDSAEFELTAKEALIAWKLGFIKFIREKQRENNGL